MGAGFAEDPLASGVSVFDFLERFLAGYMNNIQRCVGQLCQVNGPAGCFRFNDWRSGHCVVIWARFAFGNELLGEHVDHVRVFCVDHDGNARFFAFDHGVQDRIIVGVEELAFVCHEKLHGWIAGFRQFRDFVNDFRARIRHNNVESVVNHGDAFSIGLLVLFQRFDQAFVFDLIYEFDDGCGSAQGCGVGSFKTSDLAAFVYE